MAVQVFWQAKKLHQMTPREWELVCDGCGKCCLHKLEDDESGDVFYTNIACRLLDQDSCRCTDYANRAEQVKGCMVLTPENIRDTYWLPDTCAYRLLDEGIPLFDWHPLVSGDANSVHLAGMSVQGKTQSEAGIAEDDYQEHVIRWV